MLNVVWCVLKIFKQKNCEEVGEFFSRFECWSGFSLGFMATAVNGSSLTEIRCENKQHQDYRYSLSYLFCSRPFPFCSCPHGVIQLGITINCLFHSEPFKTLQHLNCIAAVKTSKVILQYSSLMVFSKQLNVHKPRVPQ